MPNEMDDKYNIVTRARMKSFGVPPLSFGLYPDITEALVAINGQGPKMNR